MHNRKSLRLKEYDYSQNGMYFITICTKGMEDLFGNVFNGKMVLNEIGKIINDEWLKSQLIRKEIELNEYVIMPDHMHGIVMINNGGDNGVVPQINMKTTDECHSPVRMKSKSISSFISGFKSSSTKQIHEKGFVDFNWQRGYYDRIIRNEKELYNVRNYIKNNPFKWQLNSGINNA